MHFNISVLFQAYKVSGQVAIRYLQHLLQVVEADLLIHYQDAHHPETNAVIKYFI